jgi:methionine synthase I (cobalamin-dependent)
MAGGPLLGIKANASPKSPEERVALGHLDAEAPERLAEEIMGLREEFGPEVLGGCCGTDHRHIEALARRLVAGRDV